MHANPNFQDLLKWIFMTQTCLFVGASLKDPDLIHLFHDAITEYIKAVSVHTRSSRARKRRSCGWTACETASGSTSFQFRDLHG